MQLASIIALISVFGLGICTFFLGSVKLRLAEELGLDEGSIGKLFSALNASNLASILVAGMLCDAFGFRPVAIGGFFAGFVALALMGAARSYRGALVACAVLGLSGMMINAVGNVMVAHPKILFVDPAQSSNLGNVFFGLGAFSLPLVTSWLFARMAYRRVFLVLGACFLAPIVLFFAADFPATGGNFQVALVLQLLPQPQLWLCALGLACYLALEVAISGWITTYMTLVGESESKASVLLSMYSLFLMVGRLFTALVLGRWLDLSDTSGIWLTFGLASAAGVALFAMTRTSQPAVARLLVLSLGLFLAPLFPNLAGIMFARTPAKLAGTAFSLMYAMALLGAILVPAWMGAVATKEGKSIKDSMAIAAVVAFALGGVALLMVFLLPARLS